MWGWTLGVARAAEPTGGGELEALLARLDEAAALALGAPGDTVDPRYGAAVTSLRDQACASGARDLCVDDPPTGAPPETGATGTLALAGTPVPLPGGGWTWHDGPELADQGRWFPGLWRFYPSADGLVASVGDHLVALGPRGTRVIPQAVPAGHHACVDTAGPTVALRLTAPSCSGGQPWSGVVVDLATGARRPFTLPASYGDWTQGEWFAVQTFDEPPRVVVRRFPDLRVVRTVNGRFAALGADGSLAVHRRHEVWLSRPDGGEVSIPVAGDGGLHLLADGGWVVVTADEVSVHGADGREESTFAGRWSPSQDLVEHPDGGSFALGRTVIARAGRRTGAAALPAWLEHLPMLADLGPAPSDAPLKQLVDELGRPVAGAWVDGRLTDRDGRVPGWIADVYVDGVPRTVAVGEDGGATLEPLAALTLPDGATPESVTAWLGPRIGPRTWALGAPESAQWPVLAADRPWPRGAATTGLRVWAWSALDAAPVELPVARYRVVDEAGRPLAGIQIEVGRDWDFATRSDADGAFVHWRAPSELEPTDLHPLPHRWDGDRLVLTGPPATPRAADGTRWPGAWDRWGDGVVDTVWIRPDRVRAARPGFGTAGWDWWFGDDEALVWSSHDRYERRVAAPPRRDVFVGVMRWAPGDVATVSGRFGDRPIHGELVVGGEGDRWQVTEVLDDGDAAPAAIWEGGVFAGLATPDPDDPEADSRAVRRWVQLGGLLQGVPLERGVPVSATAEVGPDWFAQTWTWVGPERCGRARCERIRIDEGGGTSWLVVERDTLRPRAWIVDAGATPAEVTFDWR